MKDYIGNILVIFFGILVFLGIGCIIYKDMHSLERHLEKCKQECYPAKVIEQFSKKHCMCQPIIKDSLNED